MFSSTKWRTCWKRGLRQSSIICKITQASNKFNDQVIFHTEFSTGALNRALWKKNSFHQFIWISIFYFITNSIALQESTQYACTSCTNILNKIYFTGSFPSPSYRVENLQEKTAFIPGKTRTPQKIASQERFWTKYSKLAACYWCCLPRA